MTQIPRTLLALGLLAALLAVGCSDDDDPTAADPTGTGGFELYLVDAPVDFDDVILDVQAVRVHRAAADSTAGWIDVRDDSMLVHLLELTNGVTALLGEAELEAGDYDQIRLVLGQENRVVIDGTEHDLRVPSGQHSGFKIHHRFTVIEGEDYQAILDIDARRSVHRTGNGQFILRPTLRMHGMQDVGHVAGVVMPPDAEALVWTVAGEDTVQTFADPLSGQFRLMALPEGVYDVRFAATVGTFADTTVSGVPVAPMQPASLDTVQLRAIVH